MADERVARSGHFQVLELGTDGRFIDQYRDRTPVSWPSLSSFLDQAIVIPPDVTDIFVWVHGWRNEKIMKAADLADQVFRRAEQLYQAQPECYPGLRRFTAAYILVNWPSWSSPTYWGYARIRERAHAMTEQGHASRVLAFLLGYLDQRRGGAAGPGVLRMPSGQYLHCVGHSFGGRFLAQAVIDAANPATAMLPLLPPNAQYRFTVDNLLIFQMAAPPNIFADRFRPLLENAPLQGPVCLTFSRHDQATGLLHAIAEHQRGIGYIGAREPIQMIKTTALRSAAEPYTVRELQSPIVNLDATWRYRRRWPPSGAHSDIGYAESAHLLLSLVNFAR
ncbi:MAG TPA: hypothetical protein VNF47_26700 [Streptosporangiaceae bacterium]|nr:hypothetical protein [Streptosporangiaceae bacterium]